MRQSSRWACKAIDWGAQCVCSSLFPDPALKPSNFLWPPEMPFDVTNLPSFPVSKAMQCNAGAWVQRAGKPQDSNEERTLPRPS